MAEKVTIRDTKDKIFSAYTSALEELKNAKATSYNPVAEKAEKEKTTLVENATVAASNSEVFEKELVGFADTTNTLVNSIIETIRTRSTELLDIDEAILVKKKTIEDLYGIETTVDSLAAVIEADKETRKQLQVERKAELDKHKEELNEMLDDIEKTKRTAGEETARIIDGLQTDVNRRKAELDYQFERDEKELRDKLDDIRKVHNENIEAENKEIQTRKDELSEAELALQERITEFGDVQDRISKEVSREVAIAENRLKVSHEVMVAKMEAEYQSKIAILESRVADQTTALAAERTGHADTLKKLDEAYERMEKVATASVNGARTEDTVNRLLSTINDGKK